MSGPLRDHAMISSELRVVPRRPDNPEMLTALIRPPRRLSNIAASKWLDPGPRRLWNAVNGFYFVWVSANLAEPAYNCYPEVPATDLEEEFAARDRTYRARVAGTGGEAANTRHPALASPTLESDNRAAPMPGDPLRAVFRKRALRGYWSQFPVSPAGVHVRLALLPGGQPDAVELRDWLTSGSRLAARWAELTLATAKLEPAARLAAHRACLTLIAELTAAFPRDLFWHGPGALQEHAFDKYFEVPWAASGIHLEVYVRDILEVLIWWDDDYMASTWELFDGIPRAEGDRVVAVFRELLGELERHGFGDARDRLLLEWATFVGCHLRFHDFVPLAHVVGASSVPTIQMLAEIALDRDLDSLALEVFSAANRPGPDQWRVEDACRGFLDRAPLPCPASVRAL